MQSDQPHTLYLKRKDKAKKGKDNSAPPVKADDPAFRMQKEAYERKLASIKAKREGTAPVTIDELFKQ